MACRRNHAVVLGGSMGGLLAARALSDHFERVTIIERDKLSAELKPRKGVPQGRHIHGLLAGGLRALEEMFPQFADKAALRGAIPIDVGNFGTWYIAGQKIPPVQTGMRGLLASRPLIEAHVRELLLARSHVSVIDDCAATGLLGNAARVHGVQIERRAGAGPEPLEADLVVDTTGRGSRIEAWLKTLGVGAPREQQVAADLLYTSCFIRRKPEHLDGKLAFIISPTPPTRRFGAALALEGDRYIITTTSYLGEPGPTDYPGMIEYMRSLPVPELYDLLRNAEPLSEPVQMRDPASRRHHYEELTDFPDGLLVFGDALCSFNPSYAQGMTVAALEARALDRCLAQASDQLSRRFFRAAARIIDVPWSIIVGGDFGFEGVKGARPFHAPWFNAYFQRVARAATVKPNVALAMYRVLHLMAPPSALFAPSVLAHVFRYGGGKSAPTFATPVATARVPGSPRANGRSSDYAA